MFHFSYEEKHKKSDLDDNPPAKALITNNYV